MAKTDTITIDGNVVETLVGVSEGAESFPGIVIAHHGPGLDAFTAGVIDRLAENSYKAAAPYCYHRRPEGEDRKEMIANFHDDQIIDDMNATADYLKSQPDVDADRLAIMGHCLGGRNSFLGATGNSEYKALAIFYGGNTMVPWGHDGPAPLDHAAKIDCPIIGFYGNDDINPSPDDVTKISVELTRLGKEHSFHCYDDTGHAFQNFTVSDSYREASSEDAWAKLLAFLEEHLKG